MKQIEITVYPKRKVKSQGDLFGIFFEDLNHAADGGMYGELVRNRSFEFDPMDHPHYTGMTAWDTVARGRSVIQSHVETVDPLNEQNRHFIRIEVATAGEGAGIRNEGYGSGIPVEKDRNYVFSCCYRRVSGCSAPVVLRLEDAAGSMVYAEMSWEPEATEWSRFTCEMTAAGTDFEGRLVLLMQEPVTIDLDMVSLFPKDTFKNRENGLRKDIAEMLQDMKPSFMRFPGGCLIHIGSLNQEDRNSIYRWKNTLGPVEKRPARRNNWNYNQTLGLGYFEYFQFCEDIGAQPLPVIPAGYDPHSLRAAPMDEMQEWVDEALDLIEFANGSPETGWGKIRAQMGHPESFGMKYLGIGNEEVGDQFFERYEYILKAIKEKYPEIQVIGSAGPGASGSEFDKGWKQARRTATDYMDEHFYQCPEWFIANAKRYADYPEKGPRVFLGEYASQGSSWYHGMAEAVFMIGMEKAPGVGLACYAPMLCHVDYSNWEPNMLYYDNHRVFGTASYYVQKLFMNYQGKELLETADNLVEKEKIPPVLDGFLALATERGLVDIRDFMLINNESGEIQKEISGFTVSEEKNYYECATSTGSSYTVSFKFRKRNGNLMDNLEGLRSFWLEFAGKDENNKIKWVFDGWQRMTSLHGLCDGRQYDMGLYLFDTEVDKEYEALLEVDGNKVETYIDGVRYCHYELKSPEPESLYYSAVSEGDEVIVKVVNAEGEGKQISIEIEGCRAEEAIVYCIEDTELDARNSFEEPCKVSPCEKTIALVNGKIEYFMKPYSLCVFKIKR